MASKSKRRGRVFRASCILAALIIAGSSFAWFTSKDEVTNRLTANADYGVSIVESFVPPANWLPGQEVNKDVYAVNTGSVAAFVKETITGELNYTYEIPVTDFVTTCVELTPQQANAIDGATTEEAGGFLAWTNAMVGDGNGGKVPYPTGPINSARYEDAVDTENDPGVADPRWTPPANGDYIFRRSIRNSAAEGADPVVTYTYAGYHYENGRYYKIIIGDDSFRAAEETPGTPNEIEFDVLVTGDKITGTDLVFNPADGSFTGTPDIKYVALREVKSAKPKLAYFAGDADNNAYILATYSDSNPDPASLTDAQAALLAAQAQKAEAEAALAAAQAAVDVDEATKEKNVARSEVDYQNAVYEYNTKKSRLDQAEADYNYAKALYDATVALNNAAKTRKDYQTATDAAEHNMNEARDAVTSKAATILGMTDIFNLINTAGDPAVDANAISYQKLIVETGIEDAIDGNADLTQAQTVLDNLEQDWNDIKTAVTDMKGALEHIRDLAANEDSTNAVAYLATVESKLADLKTAITDYKNRYVDLMYVANPTEAQLTYLTLTNTNADVSNITAVVNKVNGDLTNAINSDSVANDLHDLVDDYVEKERIYDAYNDGGNLVAGDDTTHVDGIAAEQGKWEAAVNAYNAAVGDTEATGAKKVYDAAIDTEQPLRNAFELLQDGTGDNAGKKVLKNHGATVTGTDGYTGLADAYSVGTNKTAGDPTLAIAVDNTDPLNPVYTYPDYNNYQPGGANAAVNPGTEAAYVAPELTKAIGTVDTNNTLKKEADVANTNKDNKKETYDADVSYLDANKATTIANLTNAVDTATAAVTAAEGAVEGAMISTSDIAIRINLADNDNDLGWKYNAAETTADPTVAAFYLKNILEGGETSTKLIDSVYLDSAVTTADYKNLTFDLNVGLDSMQVTYDADQRNYTADAVNASEDPFAMTANVGTDNSTVTWTTT